ncbi:hypothetical protein T484DRAFT_1769517 [Baffinella frigidus]|nr:hypothetical protein T484DRAFT_1769517 [Cryptophyta sp. CCMP2293]
MKVLAVLMAATLLSVAEAASAEAGFCLPPSFPHGALFSRPRGGGISMQAPLQRIDPPPATLSGPVFSLATLNADGTTNMNVLTYAVPVGLSPTRTWVISLFQGTLSHENFRTRGAGVLQLLRRRHVPLVPILGKQCGRDSDKKAASDEAGFPWEAKDVGGREEVPLLLPGCAAYYPITMKGEYVNAGEHDAVFATAQHHSP